jgi:NAD(P)-dependent dehydrogenase (short-subunit alcohol dehydrogenase family)
VTALQAAGHRVYFTSRNAAKIAALKSRLNAEKPDHEQVQGIEVDLLDPAAGAKMDAAFAGNGERPTALINNARNLDFLKVENGVTSRANFTQEFVLGVAVPYELSLRWSGMDGSLRNIINISSIYGIVPPNRALYDDGYTKSPVQYGVVKAAVIHLTRELAVRLAGHGVRVNCISYGGVEGRASPEFVARYAAMTPQRRMLQRAEVAGPVQFLLSEAAAGMTGHNLVYDGGFTVW